MASTAKHNYNVDPLNGRNYHTWKSRVRTLLEEQGVDESIRTEYKSADYTDETKRNEARKRDNKCKSTIVRCVSGNQIEILGGKETAYSMWMALEEMHEKQGLPGQLDLERKMMSLKLQENENLDEFIGRFDDTLCRLRASGVEVKEEDAVGSLLMSLPKSYEAVVTVLENLPEKDANLDFVKSKLRSEAEKKEISKPGDVNEHSESAAFVSNKPGACYGCGEQGHFKRDCRRLRDERRKPGHNGERSWATKERYGGNQQGGHRSGYGQDSAQTFNNSGDRPWNRQNEQKQHWEQKRDETEAGNLVERDDGVDAMCYCFRCNFERGICEDDEYSYY